VIILSASALSACSLSALPRRAARLLEEGPGGGRGGAGATREPRASPYWQRAARTHTHTDTQAPMRRTQAPARRATRPTCDDSTSLSPLCVPLCPSVRLCVPACSPASQPASQPPVSLSVSVSGLRSAKGPPLRSPFASLWAAGSRSCRCRCGRCC